jgi:hypothetical protein
MAGIANNIRLYNDAYQAAWEQMNASGVQGADRSARLDKIIRSLIKAGRSSASDIASEAVNVIIKNYLNSE